MSEAPGRRAITEINPSNQELQVLSYPSGMTVSSRALKKLTDALRAQRTQRATRWRKLSAGRQALLVVAYLRKGETCRSGLRLPGRDLDGVPVRARSARAASGDGPDARSRRSWSRRARRS